MTPSDSDRRAGDRPDRDAAFDALLARAVDMPTNETALAARVAQRLAGQERQDTISGTEPRLIGPALGGVLACSLALALGYGGADWLAGRSEAVLGLALGAGDAILAVAAGPAGGV